MIALALAAWAGTAEGTVRLTSGEPVSGALVVAYDSRFRYGSATSGPDGTWRIEELHPDLYRIRVIGPAGGQGAERWAGDVIDSCAAERFSVGDGLVEVDITLPRGARVEGVILDPLGEPLPGAEVRIQPSWHRELSVSTRTAITDAEGAFQITGLVGAPNGYPPSYLVEIADGPVPAQFFGQAWTEEGAALIQLTHGEAVDLGEIPTREGVHLAGVVQGPDGPVSAGSVSVTSSTRTISVPIGPDGAWSATNLSPGELLVWAVSPGLARTYWPDVDRPTDRILAADDGQIIDDVDLWMPTEARVRGQILSSGDLTRVSAVLVNDDASVAHTAVLDSAGVFVFPAVRAGTWSLDVYGGELGFVDGPVPRSVDVIEGGDVDLGRVDVARAASVSGVVLAKGSGAPVYGAAVIAERAIAAGEPPVRRLAFTATDGTYRLSGLREGSWSLEVAYGPYCANDAGWVPLGWPEARDLDLGGRVDLAPEEAFIWDIALPPDSDLDGMDDLWEAENGLQVGVDDSLSDADGDGFNNLQEYRLGTDPQQIVAQTCGCRAAPHGLFAPIALLGLLVTARRRGRAARA